MRHYLLVLGCAVLASSCGLSFKDDDKKESDDDEQFAVRAVIPTAAQLKEDVYRVGACIPMQLQAVSTDGKKRTLSLEKDTLLTFENSEFQAGGESAIRVNMFKDEGCTKKTSSATLPARKEPTPSTKTVFFKADKPGKAFLSIEYSAEGWSATKIERLNFEVEPKPLF